MSAYRYYDSPDGQDLFRKTEYLCRKIGRSSGCFAAADVLLGMQPKSYWSMAERYFRVFAPPVAAGAVFTTTVYIATKLRKKDDAWNHVLGGVAATHFLNRFFKNTHLLWSFAFPFLLTLYVYKDLKLKEGYEFQPDITDCQYNMGSYVHEYDLHKRKSIYDDPNGFVRSNEFN